MGALEKKGLQQKNLMPILEKATFKIVGNSMVFLPSLPHSCPSTAQCSVGKQWPSSQFPPWNTEGVEQHCNLSGNCRRDGSLFC